MQRIYPWVGKIPWRRNGNPLQYSCLENPMDGGAWLATVHGVAKSWTRLSDFTSVQFSHSVMSDSLQPHGLQHASLPCPLLSPRICSNSCPLSWPWNHLILCLPLLLLPSVFPSIRVFSNESLFHIRWPKYWSFSFRISPSNDYSGLISFRIDLFCLLEVQGTLESLLQHHHLKVSIL